MVGLSMAIRRMLRWHANFLIVYARCSLIPAANALSLTARSGRQDPLTWFGSIPCGFCRVCHVRLGLHRNWSMRLRQKQRPVFCTNIIRIAGVGHGLPMKAEIACIRMISMNLSVMTNIPHRRHAISIEFRGRSSSWNAFPSP